MPIADALRKTLPACCLALLLPFSSRAEDGAKIADVNGSPTFIFNGRQEALIIYRDHHPLKHIDTVKRYADSGISMTMLPASAASLATSANKAAFFKGLDKQANEILEKSPGARFLVLVSTTISEKTQWFKDHPDEATVWPPFTIDEKQSAMKKGDRISEASLPWRETISESLLELSKHINESNYGRSVAGYLLSGPPGEWTDWYDFSAPALAGYKEWLKAKYSTDDKLQAAWHNGRITFDTVKFPEWSSFFKGDTGIFFDPVKSQEKIDFLTYHHAVPGDVLKLFARKLKEGSSGKCLVGAFYGYFTGVEWDGSETTPNQICYFRMRHKALPEVLKSPDFDFIAGPYNYQERQAGGVFDHSLLPNSITLNGKMAVIEDDTRTHFTTPHPAYAQSERLGDNFGQAKDMDETLSLLKRNFAGVFSKCGGGFWYFGLGNDGNKWWDDPQIVQCAKTLSQIANERLVGKDVNASEIAVIGSYESVKRQAFNNLPKEFITRQLIENLHRIGAPFDIYLDSDLTNPKFPYGKYKLFIFLNSFHLDNAARLAIKENVRANGKTALWIYASGISDGSTLSLENVEDLTGIKLEKADIAIGGARCVVNDYSTAITKNLPRNLRYGPDKNTRELFPVIWNADPQAKQLGEIIATTPEHAIRTFRKPGLCFKKFDTWTSVWSPVPNIPSSLLRGVAQNAGVHVYDDGDDQVFASQSLLAIHASYAGTRTVKLPGKRNVYDPFAKKYVAKNAAEFEAELAQGGTGFWLLETP